MQNKNEWFYDIALNGQTVGFNGDSTFNSKDAAIIDAREYITMELSHEYNEKPENFRIYCYLGRV